MHKALYRTYRPETFEEVLGQEHIVRILKNQINSDTAGHAYLFCGTRGTGKTTMARILAKGLNCLGEGERPCGECSACKSIKEGTYLDVIEIDAALKQRSGQHKRAQRKRQVSARGRQEKGIYNRRSSYAFFRSLQCPAENS